MNNLDTAVLRAMMDRENWEVLRGITTIDSLSSSTARRVLETITNLHGEGQGDITPTLLRTELETGAGNNGELRDELAVAVDTIITAPAEDGETLKRTVKRHIARDRSLKASEYVLNHVHDTDYNPKQAFDLMDEATNAAVVLDAKVLNYRKAFSPADPTRFGVIGLGFSEEMDKFLDGGTANGELLIYLAPAGVGKTSFLWGSLAHAAKSGRNALGISLEINERKCVQRVDQYYTHMDKYTLAANPFSAFTERERLRGEVYIKDWEEADPTVDDIRALVLQMRNRGEAVDYLMVDYMELVRPEYVNRNNPRFNFSAVAKGLRRMAKELDIPVVTAWQTNRGGADKHVLTKQDVGEDWGVVKVADIILGLNQNSEELRDNMMRVNILKQRESTARDIVTLHCDLDRMILRPIEAAPDKEVVTYDLGRDTGSAAS